MCSFTLRERRFSLHERNDGGESPSRSQTVKTMKRKKLRLEVKRLRPDSRSLIFA